MPADLTATNGDAISADASALLAPWPEHGLPHLGGLPPWDRVSAAALEAAITAALAMARAERTAIAENPEPPGFANTIEALEDSGRPLARLFTLLATLAQLKASPEILALHSRLAPEQARLASEDASDDTLCARVAAVHAGRHQGLLDAVQIRLVEAVHRRLQRLGAGLPAPQRHRLGDLQARWAALFSRFQANLQADESRLLWITDEAELDGLPDGIRRQLRQAAAEHARPQHWALRNQRAIVWPVLTHARHRGLREQAWRLWDERGSHEGDSDNRPVIREILALRGEMARLLGQPSFAHLVLADRMAATPERALQALMQAWTPVLADTEQQLQQLQALAEADHPGITLQPWDRLHYEERWRHQHLGFDSEALRPYLALPALVDALFWAAGRLQRLDFVALDATVPRLHEHVAVYEVRQDGQALGVLVLDLFHRSGKGHGAHQSQWRGAENFRGRVLPVSCVSLNLAPPDPGQPALLAWEYANVLFHEFGHALHMLCNQARYPSLGSLHVAWDFVELPALLHERWLCEPALMDRFLRHHQSGQPLPAALRQGLAASLQRERVFSLRVDYLCSAIVDLRMHLAADGRPGRSVDPVAMERQIMAELGLPQACTPAMRLPQAMHCWSAHYAAGLYVYLWADILAADAAEAFSQAPDGWYDGGVARRWHDTVLSVGATVEAGEAFSRFRGRAADPTALMRRFGLPV